MTSNDWRLGLAYPLLAKLDCPLAWRSATWLGRWNAHERKQAIIAVQNGYLRAFPELAHDSQTLQAWTQRYLDLFARESMDVFCMPKLRAHNVDRYITLHGIELLKEAQREGQGIILVLNHYSRLIMLLVKLGLMGVRMNMLTMRVDEDNPELSPVMRQFLRAKVQNLLNHIGGEWLSIGDNLRPMLQGLKRGEIWIVLADAYMPHFDDWREYPFLGGQLRLSRGIERIAAKTGARMIYGVTHETDTKTLYCELRSLPTNPQDALASIAKELEKDVLAAPWEWWQWNILDYLWTPSTK
jgi:KDO2-lipid IV(A) lauroyltransferase